MSNAFASVRSFNSFFRMLAVATFFTLALSPAASAQETGLQLNKGTGYFKLIGTISGQPVLTLEVRAMDASGRQARATDWMEGVTTRLSEDGLTCALALADDSPLQLKVSGTVHGDDIFPCTPEPVAEQTPMVRSVSGLSYNGLNTGVYCRDKDWAVQFQATDLDIQPGSQRDRGNLCSVSAGGRTITVRLLPDHYQKNRGLTWYRPWEYTLPNRVPSGWISWKAYMGGITQEQVHAAADWASEKLKDYGLEYLIIDDGWFVASNRTMLHSVPEGIDWTRGNDAFSDGMAALADYVHEKGLKLGLWLSPFGCSDESLYQKHPDWWVRNGADGDIIQSGWHGKAFLDGSNPEAVSGWLTRGIRAQANNGVDYFKIDGQKHVAYDAYEKTGDYFTKKGLVWQDALRQGWNGVRRAAGNRYVLACWSRIPEIIGYPMAIRIGADKDSSWRHITDVASDLSKWFYEHNLVWCDDPDHMVFVKLNETECRTWATLVGLTGTHLTFSDKPEDYTPEKLEVLRRILPVILSDATRPVTLYKMDNPPALWTLEIDRPFDRWLVVANTSAGQNPAETLDFEKLGLSAEKSYTVYDFWNKEFKGVFKNSFPCGKPGEKETQVFAIREVREHPWIIATNRHITAGGVDLLDVEWDAATKTLSGTSLVVKQDPYILSIYAPDNEKVQTAMSGDKSLDVKADRNCIEVSVTPENTGTIQWTVRFR